MEFFRANYGPMTRAFAALDDAGRASLYGELTSHWSAHTTSDDGATIVDAEYLEVVATRA